MIAVWRSRAERDLDGLIRYVAQQDVRAAVELDLRIEQKIALLEAYPRLGHITSDGITRELAVTSSVKLFYRIRPKLKAVEIVRIIRTRRKYP